MPCERRPQRLVVPGVRAGLRKDHDIHAAELALVQAEALSHLPLDPVATNRQANPAAGERDPEASVGQAVRPVQHREATVDGPPRLLLEYVRVVLTLGESPLLRKRVAFSPGPGPAVRR